MGFDIFSSLIIVYLFAVLCFVFFPGEYTFGNDDVVYRCDTFVNCVQAHFDHGFRNGPVWNDPKYQIFPVIYDFIFFFLINVCGVCLCSLFPFPL